MQSDPIGLQGGSSTYGYVRGRPLSSIDPNGLVDIYVGGLGDASSGIVRDYVPAGGKYFEHNQGRDILNYIRGLPEGEPINLIGHSWGGDTAARVAAQACRTIDSLTTVDPVSWTRPNFDDVWGNVKNWTNVLASPSGGNFSDLVATVGRQYGDSPRGYSNFISVDTNHNDFAGMMRAISQPTP